MTLKSFLYRVMYHLSPLFSDEFYIKKQFKYLLGYDVNLEKPKTFQEKLQWLKLHDRKPIYTKMVDKYEAKKFISSIVGEEYIIPTLGIYNSVDEIDYNKLPNEFVIKTTHDSGTVIVCRDKSQLDKNYVRKYINKRLKRKYYYAEREWPYKHVKPRIIIEALIGKDIQDLRDYKFFCFSGEPKLMFIISERFTGSGHKADYYDMYGNHVDVYQPGYENNPNRPELPACFSEMKRLAAKLSKDVPHLRVDFYFADNRIYVGELTFSDAGGYLPFIPDKWNMIMGDYITLPK